MAVHRPAAGGIVERNRFRRDVLAGLRRRPRSIPCKYLYDEVGAALFDRICDLDEYTLTRSEAALLTRHGGELARLVGPRRTVVDLGAGSMRKTRLLLRLLDRPAGCIPVDIAHGPLEAESRRLAEEFPGLAVSPIAADFTRRLPCPPPSPGGRLVFFPGSTIGNLDARQAEALLRRLATLAEPDGLVLVGVDMARDRRRLEAAYADRHGVTAAFTRNLLRRIDRELGGSFRPAAFDHRARWIPGERRVEIRLVSRRRQWVRVAGHWLVLARGETIHVEDCRKFDRAGFHRLIRRAGLMPLAAWSDPDTRYGLHLLRPMRR